MAATSQDVSFNVGVVGYGMSAKVFHIPFIQHVAGYQLRAILQRTPKPGNDAGSDHPGVKIFNDLAGLLDEPEIHVVIVTSTPETHYEIAAAALDAGKHVVVEKPFAPTYKECEDLVEKAKKAGKILTVYQNRRWDLDFLTLKSLLASNTLGRVVEFETHFDRFRLAAPTNWKARPLPGGGVIYDLGTHLIDQVVTLFGLPTSVTALLYSQRDTVAGQPQQQVGGAEDSCTVLLRYADGMLVTVKAGVVSPETEQLRFWVRGTHGSFKKYGVDTQEDALKTGHAPDSQGFGAEPEAQYGMLTTVVGDAFEKKVQAPVKPETYVAFYEGLLSALRGQSEAPVDPSLAAKVIKIIELARQSSEEGRTFKL